MNIKLGIVGMGDGGRSNLRSLREIATVCAVCDEDEQVRKAAREEDASIAIFPDLSRMLDSFPEIDLVVIATPDNEHLSSTKQALQRGKYVFVEKPMATTRTDLDCFATLLKEYPGKILFSEKYSFARPIQKALEQREKLGAFIWGSTYYTMSNCDRIMGGGKWRTSHAYNPCAGGLSHNFMTALLFSDSPVHRVRATGQVLTYHELNEHGGYDTMEGTIEFRNTRRLSWNVCLGTRGLVSPYGHRTVTHTFQFEHGSLAYGPSPENDALIIPNESRDRVFQAEPGVPDWPRYNIQELYRKMHLDLLSSIGPQKTLSRHTAEQGLSVAYACLLAFDSAKNDGQWMNLPT